jgi:hypothetical protein
VPTQFWWGDLRERDFCNSCELLVVLKWGWGQALTGTGGGLCDCGIERLDWGIC